MDNSINAKYENRKASVQTIADIFSGAWKSKLPGNLESGSVDMFADGRPAWFNSVLPGGLQFKSVLELGPFEGYQTYLLEKFGASEIISVEGNSVNFLKCLCLKEILGLKAKFKIGSIMEELADPGRRYDVVWASGVLYHMANPVKFIEYASKVSNHIYFWTHYFDETIMLSMNDTQRQLFIPKYNSYVRVGDRNILFNARTYGIDSYSENIPLYWEGAPQDLTNWISLNDIEYILNFFGFEIYAYEHRGDLEGLPMVSFAASRIMT